MSSSMRLDSAVFQLTPTRTRFVRFVNTPEILERVYTTESEILQIEEAIAIQGNNSIGIGTPDAHPPEANGNATSEGNSKVQLLKVLETRKSVLQKEQGMAFARAVAAGFDIDHLPALMSFAECFGASRLMDASTKFRDLWKRKHENGQWLEIEAAEMMSNRQDFTALNGSGILLPNMAFTSHTELDSENNGKASSDLPPMDRQGNQDNMHGQFPHHMFPPWPVHSPPGAVPVYQPYPVQGIPYYQTYSGNSPYMQPNYPPMEDPRLTPGQNVGFRRHSMDSRNSNNESDSRLHDDVDMEREGSQTGDRRKKSSRSGRQKSGMVVIRNINYITKTENSSGSGSYSDSASETDEDTDNLEHVKTSKRRGSRKESLKKLDSSDKEETDHATDADGGHWQAFQNCLLRDVDEDRHAIDHDQFGMEKVDDTRRKKHVSVNDPLVLNDREMYGVQGSRTSNDAQSLEVNGRSGGYRRAVGDDFIVSKQGSQSGYSYPSSDLEITGSGLGYSNDNLQRKLFHDMNDDSYMLEHRSIQVNDAGNVDRNMIDIDSEFPRQKEENPLNGINHMNYQLDELSLMPERGAEGGSMSYDPALDYEMQAQAGGALKDKNKEVLADAKPGSKRLDKEPKSKLTPNSSDKRKTVGPIRRGKPSKLSPLEEARARAESLRNYKADLQKMKKEKEEEAIKRIETLKMERQKRIAAKSSSVGTQSPEASNVTKRRVPAKLSPSSHKGSKFSDSEPGPLSPLQRFPARTASVGSADSVKTSKTSRLSARSHLNDNKLSQSVSSLPESKLEKGDSATKASMARIRRLSEPKMSSVRQTSAVKPHGTGTISKTKSSHEPESKKISAIVNHDKSMIAALPELKVRTSKASEIVQNVSSVKVKTQKVNGNKSSMNSESTMLKKNETGISSNDDGDDNPVIEKTVVMLEREKPYAPAIYAPKKEYDSDKVAEKTETSSNYVAIRAPISPLSMDTIDKETSENRSHMKPISTEVKMDNTEKEPPKPSSICIAEETYHAPYARVSSMEDPSTRNSEYGKAAPTIFDTAAIGADTGKARVSDIRNATLEKIPEATEKPQVKESPKGFRRLLKFGKKSHSPATRNAESDNVSIDGSEADEIGTNGSSNEVHTLKNLISQDETPTASTTQQKSSRSFSLLSPFRKNSEKKDQEKITELCIAMRLIFVYSSNIVDIPK
ncbi:hypothetical protein TSUD_28330 [Trifolium subterraneum]|uniref:COP1-interacting protein 7 n=1 Tax=Trifolium subterraneum TaxID=3900 RepID=A0A2Z6NEL5_TRISU|nr:hypothetical protein TSUD_28330 [Trifolium subterraneum]